MRRYLLISMIVVLAACGSSVKASVDSKTDLPDSGVTAHKVGNYQGYEIDEYTTPDGKTCIFMWTDQDWSTSLSCIDGSTPTTTFGP